jgi:hypothetical protein
MVFLLFVLFDYLLEKLNCCFLRCKACDFEISRDTNLEDENMINLEDARHLLHGIINVNRFCHLLCVKGGSQFLFGYDIMGLWNMICIMIKATQASILCMP